MTDRPLPAEILAECKRLVLTVAPELAPLYVVNYPFAEKPKLVTAYAPHYSDFAIRDALVRYRQWEGPGNTIVFVRGMSRDEALGVAIHEAAHLLPVGEPADDLEPPADEKFEQRHHVLANLRESKEVDGLPAWYPDHGAGFIRVCLHLHHRSWAIGYEVGLPRLHCAGERYDLGAPWRYMHALRPEAEQMMDATFSDILSTPPREEFIELFRNDCRAWGERQ
jgi:hypothetical protein